LIKKEHELSIKIIEHLEEIENRKLFSDLKYPSLFAYCIGELGLSEQESYRRIDGMRLARKMPQVKKVLLTGELSLTNANMISTLFKNSNLLAKDQNKLVKEVTGISKRECERKISKIKEKHNIKDESKKEIIKKMGDKARIHLTLKEETINKIKKLKGLLAHKKNYSMEELIDMMLVTQIEKIEKEKYSSNNRVAKEVSKRSRYISKKTKEIIYQRAKGKCENCDSIYALQIDHLKPYAKGGGNSESNLQLLCRNCNLRKSLTDFSRKSLFPEKVGRCNLKKI
jgi:hypothetical protein